MLLVLFVVCLNKNRTDINQASTFQYGFHCAFCIVEVYCNPLSDTGTAVIGPFERLSFILIFSLVIKAIHVLAFEHLLTVL